MKKRNLLLLFLLLVVGFIVSDQTASAAKKLEKKEISRPLYVQQGKTYKLSKILSELYDQDEGDSLKNCLKGKEMTILVKKSQINLTKNTVKVKKQGEYNVVIKTKKKMYTITLRSLPEKWPAIPDGITRAVIMRDGNTVEVQDAATIQTLCNLFNSADYRFHYKDSNYTKCGWSYMIYLYTSDGKIERQFTISGDVALTMNGGYKCKNRSVETGKYVGELYTALRGQQ